MTNLRPGQSRERRLRVSAFDFSSGIVPVSRTGAISYPEGSRFNLYSNHHSVPSYGVRPRCQLLARLMTACGGRHLQFPSPRTHAPPQLGCGGQGERGAFDLPVPFRAPHHSQDDAPHYERGEIACAEKRRAAHRLRLPISSRRLVLPGIESLRDARTTEPAVVLHLQHRGSRWTTNANRSVNK